MKQVLAADPPATEAALKSLLAIMQTSKLMDSTMSQVGGMLQNSMKQVMAGKELTELAEDTAATLKATAQAPPKSPGQ